LIKTEHYSTGISVAERKAERPTAKLAREIYDVEDFKADAQTLIAAREHIEHDHWQQEPEINARTALFEALTAKGHLSRIAFEEDIVIINRRTLQRLLNGWSDKLPEWEQERRLAEIVEELIVQQAWKDIKEGKLSADTIIITISDYPEMAPEDSAHTVGYRALNRKGMVRAHSFEVGEKGHWQRIIEQISRSNSNDGSAHDFIGSTTSSYDVYSNSQGILSNQVLATKRELPNGVVDVQRILDSFSGEYIRYGEDIRLPANAQRLPAYAELREVSWAREAQAEIYIKRLAEFERTLDEKYKKKEMSYNQKQAALYEEREKIINEICLLDPSYARDARGELSAKYFEKAATAMASGDDASGQQYFASALHSVDARAGVACGGAGLSAPNQLNQEGQAMYNNAKENRNKWTWKKGLCIIKECHTRPNKTDVGPCNVCRGCQYLFDEGMSEGAIRRKYNSESSGVQARELSPLDIIVADFAKKKQQLIEAEKMKKEKEELMKREAA
jgi:hypothetical protein